MLKLFSGISLVVVLVCYAFGVYHIIIKLGIDVWVTNFLGFVPQGQVWDFIGIVLYLIIVAVIPLVIFLAAFVGSSRV